MRVGVDEDGWVGGYIELMGLVRSLGCVHDLRLGWCFGLIGLESLMRSV